MIHDTSKFKQILDDILKCIQNGKKSTKYGKNIEGKGEIACHNVFHSYISLECQNVALRGNGLNSLENMKSQDIEKIYLPGQMGLSNHLTHQWQHTGALHMATLIANTHMSCLFFFKLFSLQMIPQLEA